MKKLITILTLLLAASTMSAQPTNLPLIKGRTHERENLFNHERALPNEKMAKPTTPKTKKGGTTKQITNATLKMDSVTFSDGMNLAFEYDNLGRIITLFEWYDKYEGSYKYELTYNTLNQTTQTIEYFKDTPNAQWKIKGKYNYEYDAQGNQTLSINSYWDADLNQWRNWGKTEYTYDAQGNQTLYAQFRWDADLDQWRDYSKSEFEYDAQGNKTLVVHYDWATYLNQMIKSSKFEYEYDAQGNQTLEARSFWNEELNQWENSNKYEYEYDAHGNKTLEVRSYWNEELNQWENSDKSEYEYDAQGNQTLKVYYSWDYNLNQWEEHSKYKTEYEYDTYGNVNLKVAYFWDKELNQWRDYSKFESEYDTQGNQIWYAYYELDEDLQWIGWKSEYEYDAHGNQTLYISYSWDTNLNQWINSRKYESTYNLSYTWADVICWPDLYDHSNTDVNIVLTETSYHWDETISDWGEPTATTYYYSAIEIGIAHHTQPNITIFPNPTSGELRIESGELGELRIENGELRMETVEVFDMLGRKQHAEIRESDGGVLLNITHLPSGIYLVKAAGRVWKVVKQ